MSGVPGRTSKGSDEQQIRALIEAWAIAAHDGDLATVLADHAPDIVMFDVPPPAQGVRGIGAYRDTWLSRPAPRPPSPTRCCAAEP